MNAGAATGLVPGDGSGHHRGVLRRLRPLGSGPRRRVAARAIRPSRWCARSSPVSVERRALRAPRRDEPGRDGHGWDARARRALSLVLDDLVRVSSACARLAREHRDTPMAGRTLLQQAVPTTFGLKAAGWLIAVMDAARGSSSFARGPRRAAGRRRRTLSALASRASSCPPHTHASSTSRSPRSRGTRTACGSRSWAPRSRSPPGCWGRSVSIWSSSHRRVGEVREGGEGGLVCDAPQAEPGRRDVGAGRGALVRGHASVLTAALVAEHERAGGAWRAEWEALSGALAAAGGAASALAGSLEGLQVDAARMRANLDLSGGAVVAERLASTLTERLGRTTARSLVRDASLRASDSGRSLAEELGERDTGLTTGRGSTPRSTRPRTSAPRRPRRPRARTLRGRAREESGRRDAAPRPRRVCGCAGGRAVELARHDARDVGAAGRPAVRALPGRPQRPARARAHRSSTGRRGSTTSARTSSSCSTSSGSSARLVLRPVPRRSGGGWLALNQPAAGRPAGARVHGGVVPSAGDVGRAGGPRPDERRSRDRRVGARRWFRRLPRHALRRRDTLRGDAGVDAARGLRRLLRRARRRRPDRAPRRSRLRRSSSRARRIQRYRPPPARRSRPRSRARCTSSSRARPTSRTSSSRSCSRRRSAIWGRTGRAHDRRGTDEIHARGMGVRRAVLGNARRPRDRAHDAFHGGLPGPDHALCLGRDLVPPGPRPPHAELITLTALVAAGASTSSRCT